MEQRQALVERRKRAAADARLQKELMLRAMEELKTDSAKADKVIKKALTGKITLSAIVKPEQRSPSAPQKSKKKRSKSTSELLGVKRTVGGEEEGASNQELLDMHLHFSTLKHQNNVPAPLPYVSPYELTSDLKSGTA